MTMDELNIGWNFNNSYAKLPEHFYTRLNPVKAKQPNLVIINESLGKDLGLNVQLLSKKQLAQLFSGTVLPQGAEPISQAYAGHQFGYFTYLGDGRAHLLGEHTTPTGQHVDVQFKGSGQTPYGYKGDGKAALGPMLREYIISEAMYALGIPTTRSLAVVTTGEPVYRETIAQGAILTRIASSHIRVGTFEYLAAEGDQQGLKMLADYTIARHYPEAAEADNPYLYLLTQIIKQQINLIVHWMRVGFIHGVMNTDNMAISGETIDYGPCAFMDFYDPETVFSSIDINGRYKYANQPSIAQWNLARLAEALLPLLHSEHNKAIQYAQDALEQFSPLYKKQWLEMMRAKLGLLGEQKKDKELIDTLLNWMQLHHADFTNTFRTLGQLNNEFSVDKEFHLWYGQWQTRLQQNNQSLEASFVLMNAHNPSVIPRNHKVHQALEAAEQGDMNPFNALLAVVMEPYKSYSEINPYQLPPTPQECILHTFCGT